MTNAIIVAAAVAVYFLLLAAISRVISARQGNNNETFFHAGRRSPWQLVAFGMIGASISGVTFVSVPGMVLTSQMTYLQVCMGFILGYLAVAFILLPVYYRLNLTTIYAYLGQRFGPRSYTVGSAFFLLSKMFGAAMKFYVVCTILHAFVFSYVGMSFPATVVLMVLLIWLYTRRGGIATLVFTDTFQTVCLFTALLLIIWYVTQDMNLTLPDAFATIAGDPRSQAFEWHDMSSPQFFWKQLLSGAFIVIVMTGLDQDMMQKNLTCRTLRDAQKNMCSYGLAFLPANFLFLALGVLLAQWYTTHVDTTLPTGDDLLLQFVTSHGLAVKIIFTIGIMAASFSSADSALTSLTTSFCVDICHHPADKRLRQWVHAAMCLVFAAVIVLVFSWSSNSLIDTIYTIVSYTYGPLLGLFAYGLFTRRPVGDRWVPFVCVASPLLCYAIDHWCSSRFDYHFGYELLMLNGLITIVGLWLTSLCTHEKSEKER